MIYPKSQTISLLIIDKLKYCTLDYALAAAHLTLTCSITMFLIPACAYEAHKRLLNIFIRMQHFYDIRNTTINTLHIAFAEDMLLKDCSLHSDDVNEQIFLMVQSFIIKSNRFN